MLDWLLADIEVPRLVWLLGWATVGWCWNGGWRFKRW